jgi:hypothetical protein
VLVAETEHVTDDARVIWVVSAEVAVPTAVAVDASAVADADGSGTNRRRYMGSGQATRY